MSVKQANLVFPPQWFTQWKIGKASVFFSVKLVFVCRWKEWHVSISINFTFTLF